MTVQTTLATPNRFSLPSVSGVGKERGVRGQPAPEKNIEETKVSMSFIVGMEFTPPHPFQTQASSYVYCSTTLLLLVLMLELLFFLNAQTCFLVQFSSLF